MESQCKEIDNIDKVSNTLGLSEQESLLSGEGSISTNIKATQTFWNTSSSLQSNNFTKPIYYTLFMNNGSNYPTYWLSSRCVDCRDNDLIFEMRRVITGHTTANDLFWASNGNLVSHEYLLRPIVVLSENIQIGEKVNNVWQIK